MPEARNQRGGRQPSISFATSYSSDWPSSGTAATSREERVELALYPFQLRTLRMAE